MNQIMKKHGSKAALVVLTAVAAPAAMAAGLDDISSTITAEINKVIPIVSAVGMALLSVGVAIKAFRLVQGFLGTPR